MSKDGILGGWIIFNRLIETALKRSFASDKDYLVFKASCISLPSRLQNTQDHLSNTRQQLEEAEAAVDKPFPYEEDLTAKSARLAELNALLDMDRPENEIVDSDRSNDDSTPTLMRGQER